ncbi:hypothetical protein GYMLUDRAFT_237560 [Collybiopsis luxurians FD-317 M1]|nr:hypothetical protein GYMLUDRAFT_237560 [Collybiopsis luxurians FD-317 M1]
MFKILTRSTSAVASDNQFNCSVQQNAGQITKVSLAESQSGVDIAPIYPNDVIYDTSLEVLDGDNIARMQSIKAKVDPNNVMSFTGFKL